MESIIGLPVHFYPGPGNVFTSAAPLAAFVASDLKNGRVNVGVLDPTGRPFQNPPPGIQLLSADDTPPTDQPYAVDFMGVRQRPLQVPETQPVAAEAATDGAGDDGGQQTGDGDQGADGGEDNGATGDDGLDEETTVSTPENAGAGTQGNT